MPTLLITGANRGLGLEFARQYLSAGWRVLATCRDTGAASDLTALAAENSQLTVHSLDVADFQAIDVLAASLQGVAIDVLLNNAAFFGPKAFAERDLRQSFGSIDYAIWQQLFHVNTMAPMKMAEAFVSHVAASQQKKIVMMSSIEGSIDQAATRPAGLYAYRSSKAALNMLTRGLAHELAPLGIATASFCPGWVRTRMGGSQAPLDAPPSIRGIRQRIADLTVETSGRFWLWSGEGLPW
jgi:NAD(P)-dependent dehydrogenase (short-subunit alcohol dehydrogenase family)